MVYFVLPSTARNRIRVYYDWANKCFKSETVIGVETYEICVNHDTIPDAILNVPIAYAPYDIEYAIQRGDTYCIMKTDDNNKEYICVCFR
jgi:hypothetical protein